jgi:hypothetical protein
MEGLSQEFAALLAERDALREMLRNARPYIQPLKTYDDRCLDLVVAIDAALREGE